jgi:hypothetical protein
VTERIRVAKKQPRIQLLLDSGAFSAWNQGTSIDLNKYIRFLREYEKHLFSYVVLDVLPSGQESARTVEANERGAELSDINQQRMKDAGLSPIPVFHQGESFKWLERMLKNGEGYIGVSSRKDLTHRQVIPWLDDVWSILADNKGRPIVKTHGFGITAMPMLLRYPWFTVDSTTWALSAGFGLIYCPVQGPDGRPNYLDHPYRIVTSGMSQEQPGQQNRQFDRMGPAVQKWIRSYIEDECGLSMSEVRNNAEGRRRAILTFYVKMAEELRDVRFTNHRSSMSPDRHGAKQAAGERKGFAKIDHLRIMYATSYNKQFSAILNSAGANTRLISYYEIQDKDPALMLQYIAEGTIGEHVPQIRKTDWKSEQYLSHRRIKLSDRHLSYPEEEIL